MYVKWIDEFTVIPAPPDYWGIPNFNRNVDLMQKHGFLPLHPALTQPHKRLRYTLRENGVHEEYVEYSGEALAGYRRKMIDRLQAAFKEYEQRFVNSSDLTMASTLAVAGKPKGMAVAAWVAQLWQAYFTEKDKIEKAQNAADFATVVIEPWQCGEPPYPMRELSEETAQLFNPAIEE